MYIENNILFTLTKIGYGASKKSFPLVYKTMRVMRINSSIDVVNFGLSLDPFSFSLSGGFPWLSLVTSWSIYLAATAEDFCK